jgi:hypothetical protein
MTHVYYNKSRTVHKIQKSSIQIRPYMYRPILGQPEGNNPYTLAEIEAYVPSKIESLVS